MSAVATRIVALAAAFTLFAAGPGAARAQTGRLVVHVEGARNTRGLMRVSLFDSVAGFPERSERAVRTASVAVSQPTTDVAFDGVPAGMWAVAVLHDENENGRLDRNLFRIPREGVGASNDAVRFGPPKFDDARVAVPADGVELLIRLHYWR